MSNAVEIRDLHYRAGKSFEIRDLALNADRIDVRVPGTQRLRENDDDPSPAGG